MEGSPNETSTIADDGSKEITTANSTVIAESSNSISDDVIVSRISHVFTEAVCEMGRIGIQGMQDMMGIFLGSVNSLVTHVSATAEPSSSISEDALNRFGQIGRQTIDAINRIGTKGTDDIGRIIATTTNNPQAIPLRQQTLLPSTPSIALILGKRNQVREEVNEESRDSIQPPAKLRRSPRNNKKEREEAETRQQPGELRRSARNNKN